MSNLSELLPAGAGAKSAEFVASGTLGSGVTVVLKSDGTVEAVGETSISDGVGASSVFESATSVYISATYNSSNNKVVIAYRDDGNSSRGTAVVGTVSGTSITFGSRVTFTSAQASYISSAYDANSNKVVFSYQDLNSGDRGFAIVGTVSGTSISFGSAASWQIFGNITFSSISYDPNSQKIVIAYTDSSDSNYGKAVVGTVSGTSISFGTSVVFNSGTTNYIASSYDSSAQKTVISYRNNSNSNYGTAIVGTVSGTSISFGSAVVFESANSQYIASAYDLNENKLVIAYQDSGNSGYGTAVVGTVSGTSISFGSPVVFNTGNTFYNSISYDENAKKIVVSYTNGGSSNQGTAKTGAVSGTTLSFNSPISYGSATSVYIASAYDSASKKVVIAYRDDGNSYYGTAIVYQAAYDATNSADFIGITDQAIADTATGAVIVQGGVSEKVSSLTTGSDYYVQYDGSLSTTVSSVPAGRALSTTSILLEG